MRSIDERNIEEWLFDHIEGELSPEEELQLEAFLILNPKYREELGVWEKAFVEDSFDHPMVDVSLMSDRRWFKAWRGFWVYSFLIGLILIGAQYSLDVKGTHTELQVEGYEVVQEGASVAGSDAVQDQSSRSDSPSAVARSIDGVEGGKEQCLLSVQGPIAIDAVTPAKNNGATVARDGQNKHEIERLIGEADPMFCTDKAQNATVDQHGNHISDGGPAMSPLVEDNEMWTSGHEAITQTKEDLSLRELKKQMRKNRKAQQKAKALRDQQNYLNRGRPYIVPIDLKNF